MSMFGSSPKNHFSFSNPAHRRQNFSDRSQFGFAGNGFPNLGAYGQSPSVNVTAYRPQNVNVVHLPAGMGPVVMDPRKTSLTKIKSILKMLNHYEKKMMQQCEKKMTQHFSDEISGQDDGAKRDPIDQMMDERIKNIMKHQKNTLNSVLNNKGSMGF